MMPLYLLVGLVLVLVRFAFAFLPIREVICKPTRFIPGSQGAKDIKPPLHRQAHTHNTSCPDGLVWELERGHAQTYYAENSQQHDVSQSHTSHFTPRTTPCQAGSITADSAEGSEKMPRTGVRKQGPDVFLIQPGKIVRLNRIRLARTAQGGLVVIQFFAVWSDTCGGAGRKLRQAAFCQPQVLAHILLHCWFVARLGVIPRRAAPRCR
jgi:hypothetical protein